MAASPGQLVASVPGHAAPLSPRDAHFHDTLGNRSHVLPMSAIDALDRCRAFRPFAQHVATVAAAYPAGAHASIEQGMRDLAQRRLLVDGNAWIEQFATSSHDDSPLRAIFIRACDRPAQLARLLATLLDNERRHRGRHRYVLLDDSRNADAAARHAALLTEFGSAAGTPVEYIGRIRWAAIAARIAPEPAVHAALAPAGAANDFGGGRGFNLAALLGHGGRYVLLDDDFVLPLRAMRANTPLHMAIDRSEPARFHANVDAALVAGVELDGDPFDLARTTCGQSLGALLRAARDGANLALEGFEPSNAAALRRDARIAAVALGHRGHSGTVTSRWILQLDRASLQSAWHEGAGYASNREANAVWFGAPEPCIVTHAVFTPFAVDATHGAPPTVASGRNEDLLFGVLQHALDPAGLSFASDATIGHVQEAARDRVTALGEPLLPAFNQMLVDHVRDVGFALSAAGDARYASLAASLRDMAESPPTERSARAHEHVARARADLSMRLEAVRAENPDAPAAWCRDVDAAITAQRRALADTSSPLFTGWPRVADTEVADRVGAGFRALADLLDAWPTVAARARSLDPYSID